MKILTNLIFLHKIGIFQRYFLILQNETLSFLFENVQFLCKIGIVVMKIESFVMKSCLNCDPFV